MVRRHSVQGRLHKLRDYRRRLPPRKTYARFYGRFENKKGEIRGYEFQVRVSDRLSNKVISVHIGNIQSKMKYSKVMPYHMRRETFSSFADLLSRPWVRIRGVTDYDVQMDYPTPFSR